MDPGGGEDDMQSRRRTGSALAVAALAVLLTGCSPVPEGVSGLSVDEQGRLVGLVRTCDTQVVAVRLERYVAGTGPDEVLVRAETSVESESTARVVLDEALGISARGLIEQDEWHSLVFLTDDGAKVIEAVSFAESDIEGLQPGEVLVGLGHSGPTTPATTTPATTGGVEPGAADTTSEGGETTTTRQPPPRLVSEDEFWAEDCRDS